jgi:hypothetical protein
MPKRAAENGTPERKLPREVKASDPFACNAPAMIVVKTVAKNRRTFAPSFVEWGSGKGGKEARVDSSRASPNLSSWDLDGGI